MENFVKFMTILILGCGIIFCIWFVAYHLFVLVGIDAVAAMWISIFLGIMHLAIGIAGSTQ